MALGFAYTQSTAAEILPAVGATTTIEVSSTSGMVVGSTVKLTKTFTPNAGSATFTIQSITNSTSFVGVFLGASGDVAPGATINAGGVVYLISDDTSFNSCNVDSTLIASSCFGVPCLSDSQREALQIYFRIKALAAIGGTDYSTTLNALQVAAGKWRILTENQRKQIETFDSYRNSTTNGATLDTDMDALTLAAKCYVCLPSETRKNLLLYLRCLLNTRGLSA